MVSWGFWALVGTAGIPIGILLAAWVLRSGRGMQANRRLAALLVVDGTVVGTAGGLTFLADSAAVASAFRVTIAALALLMPLVYVRFLALLDSPFRRVLRSRATTITIATLGAILAVLVLTRTGFQIELKPTAFGAWEASWVGAIASLAFAAIGLSSFFGLIVSLTATLRARKGSLARRQAATFAAAFGIRDVIFLVIMTLWSIEGATGVQYLGIIHWGIPVSNLAPLLEMIVLTYGLLRFQLLDIELRLKWTIHRGTVAAIFLAVFFIVAVTAENFLTDRYGWAIGGIAAGLLLFAIAPLQRLGERVAHAAMPRVTDSAEYQARRRREVYQAAYEGMLSDGRVTEKEKDVLADLATNLGLAPRDVRVIEKGVS